MKTMQTYSRRAIVILVIVQYCSAIGYASDEAGCSHNGTMFADGSLVPSLEPCLSCKCVDSHLRCSLRVCPEQPVPPPRGCVLVHKRSSCCPHVSCKKYHNENENSDRRVITYNSNWYNDDASDGWNEDVDVRQKTLSKNSLYRRIEDEEIDGNDQMCVHNGTIYRTGSAMSTSSLCSYCYCIGGKQKCIRPKCLITSPGCVPVFIDSSCCPIRYDCGLVTSDESTSVKPKTVYYRIENKHYNRMRSRAQRNRGCLVASTYYAEGEKLPNESEKPCDICFCIRGERKCTPKKCAPYIGNCKPKIPEGQCCPANYECDHSDDTPFGSSHRPRQFGLFSYFFSDETTEHEPNGTSTSSFSPTQDLRNDSPISSTSEKSFLDAIREGLNYIDSNDEHVENILDPSGVNTTINERPLQKNATELSFLDIFLGDDDDDDDNEDDDEIIEKPLLHDAGNFIRPTDSETVYISNLSNGEFNRDRYALVTEESTLETTTPGVREPESLPTVKLSNSYDRSATERIISEYITYTLVPDHNSETSTLSTNSDFETSTFAEMTTTSQDDSTIIPTSDVGIISETTATEIEGSTKFTSNEQSQITTTEPSVVSVFFETFSHLFKDKNALKEKHSNGPQNIPQKETSTLPETINIGGASHPSTQSPPIPKTTRRVNPTIVSSTAYPYVTSPIPLVVTVTSQTTKLTSTAPTTTTTTMTPSTLPSKSPTTVTIHTTTTTTKRNSHRTTTPVAITASPPFKTSPDPSNPTVSSSPKVTVQPNATKHPSTTASHPPLIDSNPSILDSDLNYDYGDQPTLPPSLPNLKIIPFLPTDAVRKDNVHPKLEYYSTSYPVLTENYENLYLTSDNLENQNGDFTAFAVDEAEGKESYNHHSDNSDFNSYSIKTTGYANDELFGIPKTNGQSPDYNSQYPSITEKPSVEPTIINKYPVYNVDYDYEPYDVEKRLDKYVPGSYEVLDGHEYGVQSRNPSFDKFPTEYPERHVHSKIAVSTENPLYGYNGNNKFSPPSKTEGGFLPKEPLDDDQYFEKVHTTKYQPDLLTEPSQKVQHTSGQPIGITSENPFKNVIRTEPPPNLIKLIEDKDKLFYSIPDISNSNIDHDYASIHLSDLEKEIISITTDSNYNSSPDYAIEPLTDNTDYPSHHLQINETINNGNETLSVNSKKLANSTSTKYSTEVSVSSNFQPKPTVDSVPKDFLGSLLGYLFNDNKSHVIPESTDATPVQEKQTIPPFKKISSTSLSLMDILNFTKPVESSSKKAVIPQRKNNKIYEYPTTAETAPDETSPDETSPDETSPDETSLNETSTPKVENLNILRDVLLATLNGPSNIDPIASHQDSHPTIDVPKPIYSSHSIHQFLNPIFAGNSELTHATSKYSPISSDIDLTIPKLNSQIGDNKDELNNNVFGPESYQVLNDYPGVSNQRPFGENPIDYDALKEQHTDEHSPSIYTQPSNRFQNSMGLLKLAGCNIYGRMYRVGRIITELSNPCLECKCTEVGVHCTTLSC